jgi:deoxyadenosine/deoxycytidine kinase
MPPQGKKSPYIAVAGNIGCGKSTLVQVLCEHDRAQPFFEPNAENPFLKDFYRDMKGYAFQSQLWFLGQKFRMHQALEQHPGAIIQDRTVWEDAEIFARGLYRSRRITKRQWSIYETFYEGVAEAIRPPDVIFYLHAPVREIRRRIRQRGRPEEQAISARYLGNLNDQYEAWMGRWDKSPVRRIDGSKLRYLDDLWDRQVMLEMVAEFL